MDATDSNAHRRPSTVRLGAELDRRVDALCRARHPSPPRTAMVRALVAAALPSFEAGPNPNPSPVAA